MEKVKISDSCNITNGFAFKSDKYVQNNGARVIRITNVQKGKIVDNDPKLYPFDLLKNLDTYKIFEGDILMSLTGNVGRVGKFPKEMIPAYINQRICRIMPKDEKLDINFLFQFLNNDIFEREAMRNSSGAAQLNLSTKWLNNYEIPLPPLPIQKTIAAKLDKAQEIIAYNKQLLEKYDQLTQALFVDMFGDPVKNEKGFPVEKLEKFYISKNEGTKCGPFGGALKKDEFVESGIPVWNMDNISKKGKLIPEINLWITEEKYNALASYSVINEDIIISRAGTVGKMCVVNSQYKESIISTNLIRLRLDKSLLLPVYFVSLMIYFKEKISKLRTGAEGAFTHMNTGVLNNILFPYPPIQLQNQFADRIEKIELQKQMAQESLA